jgi:hypothetical protein
MISEFLDFENRPLYGHYTFKHLAILPFVFGILTLGYYYLWWRPKNEARLEPF